jgi:hypothetical protein
MLVSLQLACLSVMAVSEGVSSRTAFSHVYSICGTVVGY